jgi:lipoprotein-anchoring transpeptidase ErfK/SrfK
MPKSAHFPAIVFTAFFALFTGIAAASPANFSMPDEEYETSAPQHSGSVPPVVVEIPKNRPSGKKTAIQVNERQGEALIYEEVLSRAASLPHRIVVKLSAQKVYLLVGDEVAVESPISSGRKPGMTPKGQFHVMEKDLNHHSNRYGDLVDGSGRVIKKNAIAGQGGGTFRGASMHWFLRLNEEGVGMHAGILPGYPASHGCIRLPRGVAERLFSSVPQGTPVVVED